MQELSTVIRHDLKPFIFVINNSGYTVERAVLGKDAKYNDVANWRYSELANVFSRDKKAETYDVETSNELQKVLDSPHSGMVFVECVMDKYDAPIDLIIGDHALADSDYGVPGPQSAANSQIPLSRCATTSTERDEDQKRGPKRKGRHTQKGSAVYGLLPKQWPNSWKVRGRVRAFFLNQ